MRSEGNGSGIRHRQFICKFILAACPDSDTNSDAVASEVRQVITIAPRNYMTSIMIAPKRWLTWQLAGWRWFPKTARTDDWGGAESED